MVANESRKHFFFTFHVTEVHVKVSNQIIALTCLLQVFRLLYPCKHTHLKKKTKNWSLHSG